MECPNFDGCGFLSAYAEKEETSMAVKGFKKKYCSNSFKECRIYQLSQELDKNKIPVNMMPNGFPITNTDESNWPEEIKSKLKELR